MMVFMMAVYTDDGGTDDDDERNYRPTSTEEDTHTTLSSSSSYCDVDLNWSSCIMYIQYLILLSQGKQSGSSEPGIYALCWREMIIYNQ